MSDNIIPLNRRPHHARERHMEEIQERTISGGDGKMDSRIREAIYALGRSGKNFTVYQVLAEAKLPVTRVTASRASGIAKSALSAGLLQLAGRITDRPATDADAWVRLGKRPIKRKMQSYKGGPALAPREEVS